MESRKVWYILLSSEHTQIMKKTILINDEVSYSSNNAVGLVHMLLPNHKII